MVTSHGLPRCCFRTVQRVGVRWTLVPRRNPMRQNHGAEPLRSGVRDAPRVRGAALDHISSSCIAWNSTAHRLKVI